MAGESLERRVRTFGSREGDDLDFFELVLAEDAARVAARGAGFGAEARREGRVLERQ